MLPKDITIESRYTLRYLFNFILVGIRVDSVFHCYYSDELWYCDWIMAWGYKERIKVRIRKRSKRVHWSKKYS